MTKGNKPGKASRPAGKQRSKPKQANSQKVARQRDEWLALMLNPSSAPLVGIPDTLTLPSVKFRTNARFNAGTTVSGSGTGIIFAIAPRIRRNFLKPGTLSNLSDLNLIVSGTGATATASTCTDTAVTAKQLAYIETTYSSVRPTAMEVLVYCDQALLDMKGSHGMKLQAGSSLPWTVESAATSAAGLTLATEIGNQQTPCQSRDEIVATFDELRSVKEPVRGIWSPADTLDQTYLPTAPAGARGDSFGWHSLNFNGTTLGGTTVYNVPWKVRAIPASTLTGPGAGTLGAGLPSLERGTPPYLLYCAEGVVAGTTVFVEVTICWEGIPYPNLMGFNSATTPSPSDPQTMAHATNVMEMVPKVSFPSVPGDAPTAVQNAAMAEANNPGKSSISSFIRKGAGIALGMAAPALAAVPGIGPGLAAGAGIFSALLR